MYNQILSPSQIKILPKLQVFKDDFYLVGGTALALQLGHRSSIDFDLFTRQAFDHQSIINSIKTFTSIDRIAIDTKDELTLFAENIKYTFYTYPYDVEHSILLDDILTMSDVLTIAAMKAYALGRRAKWKDYVDLYFVLQKFSLQDLIARSKKIFDRDFEEKLFREQLAYHQDINFSESVIFQPNYQVSDDTIKHYLLKTSIQITD